MKGLLTQKTAEAFDTWAESYESDARKMIERRGYSYEILAFEILASLRPNPGSLILEIGTGPGLLGDVVTSESSIELAGIDISTRMLEQARLRRRYTVLSRANAERLPFASESFDGLFSAFVLHSVLNQRNALREIRRVLKPKAPAVIIDLCPIHRSLWQSVLMGIAHSIHYEYGAPSRYIPVEHLIGLALQEDFLVKGAKPMGIKKTYSHFLLTLERRE